MLTRTVIGRTWTYSHCVGREANAGAGFRYPVDLSLTSSGVAYVLNGGSEFQPASRVTKCLLGDEPGQEEYIVEFGTYGSDEGQLIDPTAIALDRDENVYVADEALNRIAVFDSEGNFLTQWGTLGGEEGELSRPWGLAFDLEESLWVVDSGNHRVQRFTKEGKFLSTWGSQGTGDCQFNMPWGITLDSEGDVYVADWYNGRVQKFGPQGQHLLTFGAPGSGQGELRRPSGVAVDEEGDVYVVDWKAHQVQAYGPDGTHLTTFEGDAQQLPKWGMDQVASNPDVVKARKRVKSLMPEWRLYYPAAVEVDDRRRIVITEVQRGRLQIYIKEKNYVDPQFNL